MPRCAAEPDVNILGSNLDAAAQCEAVLRSLPSWFGIEAALRMYARDSALLPTFAIADDAAQVFGFLSLTQHFAASWEVHCVAVRSDTRNQGHGRALFAHAERPLVDEGARWLQVRTLAATRADPSYARRGPSRSGSASIRSRSFPSSGRRATRACR